MGPPFFYREQNVHDAVIQPSTVHVTNTGLSRFFQKYLLQRAISVFSWDIPKAWAKNYMLYCLYIWGYVAIINTDKYGVIPQQCGLRGYNIFYQPTEAIIVNPLIRRTITPRIGVECALLRLQPDYTGIFDLVSYYGDQMALTAQSFGVNALNSKLAYFFMTDNSKLAQSLRKLYDNYAKGEPAVVADKKLFDVASGNPSYKFEQVNATDPQSLNNLLTVLKQLEIMFDNAVGIPNVSTTKRERELKDELASNFVNSRSLASSWLENLQETCREVSNMFHVNLSVDWREDYGGTSILDNKGNSRMEPKSI